MDNSLPKPKQAGSFNYVEGGSNPTNSFRSISNIRTRSSTVNYAFPISAPGVRNDNVSHAETADSYAHPESNPPSQQMSPVPYPRTIVLASAGSETELYPTTPPPTPRRRPRSSTPRGRRRSPLLSRSRAKVPFRRALAAPRPGCPLFKKKCIS